jgi:hypothetical protein
LHPASAIPAQGYPPGPGRCYTPPTGVAGVTSASPAGLAPPPTATLGAVLLLLAALLAVFVVVEKALRAVPELEPERGEVYQGGR